MPEEPQHDPNVPDPKKPWCPRCKAPCLRRRPSISGLFSAWS